MCLPASLSKDVLRPAISQRGRDRQIAANSSLCEHSGVTPGHWRSGGFGFGASVRGTVRVRELNWMQLEAYLRDDDRIVLPVGSTEQHAYLSLETENILAERAAVEAAEPLGVPVLPVLPYGVNGFTAYPGSPTLRDSTLVALLSDVAESVLGRGFAGILIVNGHGGNSGAGRAWTEGRLGTAVIWHELWEGRPDEVAAAI